MSLAIMASCGISIFVGSATFVSAGQSVSLSQLWREVRQKGRYVPPGRTELQQAERLFLQTFRGQDGIDQLSSAWSELDFELLPLQIAGEQIWVLREKPGFRKGRGFYAFRHQDAVPTAIQAPHCFYDEHTQAIAVRLFRESFAAATAWNTLHRAIADLPHSRGNYLDAFTRAFAAAHATAMVVQLHGFAQEKRRTEAAASADLIISGGTIYPSRWLQESAVLFQQHFPHGTVRLYPHEVSELGGTTNVQGEILRSASSDGFMHLELSDPLRRKMRRDRSVRQEFLEGLSKSYAARVRKD
jgi:hypothetical protein